MLGCSNHPSRLKTKTSGWVHLIKYINSCKSFLTFYQPLTTMVPLNCSCCRQSIPHLQSVPLKNVHYLTARERRHYNQPARRLRFSFFPSNKSKWGLTHRKRLLTSFCNELRSTLVEAKRPFSLSAQHANVALGGRSTHWPHSYSFGVTAAPVINTPTVENHSTHVT